MKSADSVATLPARRPSRSAEELAFLPAALEIVETPPPPLAGAIGGTIVALFCLALIWAIFGQLDIVTTATGKIVPSGRTKIIQPFETGVVRAIHVHDGQTVAMGEALIELDPTITDAESKHFESDLITAELDIARLTAALSDEADPLAAFHPPADAPSAMVSRQRAYLLHQVEEQRAKLANLDGQKTVKEAELATIKASVAKLEAVLPVLQERVDIKQMLYDHQTGSRASYLELYQSMIEGHQDLLVQKGKQREAEAALAAIADQSTQTITEFRRTLSGELVEAQRKAAGLNEDVIKARQRTRLQLLTAPVDGTVQQLAVHTVGGVVTPAQQLMVVVPADSHLEIEAQVPNRDIGFVHVDQDVEIKIDTFNFTRYGLLHGKVLSVSQDAIVKDKPPEKATEEKQGATTDTSEPKGQELVYAARISLDKTRMLIEDNLVNLSPGMAVTAEIKTGSRSIISYLLSPLLRYKHESLRER